MKLLSRTKSIFLIAICSISLFFIYNSLDRGPLYDFDPTRDTQDIVQLFNQNYYWLVPFPDYSPQAMLKERSPKIGDPFWRNKQNIKVARKKNKFFGFIAYHIKTPTQGFIHFLVITQDARNKGYGKLLLTYAINDLFAHGAQTIDLVTRTNNFPAQKLYTSVGFTETSRDAEYVYFSLAS